MRFISLPLVSLYFSCPIFGWFSGRFFTTMSSSREEANLNRAEYPSSSGDSQVAQVVKSTGVRKEAGYLYYLGKDGHVWRTKMARGGKKTGGGPERVALADVSREDGWLYYIDKSGDVSRSPMARGRR